MSNVAIGRLAFRQEGEFWCAYYAGPNDLQNAQLLGSIRMTSVIRNEHLKRGFIELMKTTLSDAIESTTGASPDWSDLMAAPEHERSGNA